MASALAGHLGNLRPVLGLQYEMGSGAAMWAGDQFDLRQKLRLTRNLALEARHLSLAKRRSSGPCRVRHLRLCWPCSACWHSQVSRRSIRPAPEAELTLQAASLSQVPAAPALSICKIGNGVAMCVDKQSGVLGFHASCPLVRQCTGMVCMTASTCVKDVHIVDLYAWAGSGQCQIHATSWQVCGAAQLPVPSARYSMGENRTEVSVGDGAFHLHVAQINAILHL